MRASRMLSVAGVNGAFVAADGLEVGSPGTIAADTTPPTIDPHADVVVSAIDASGAIATYTTPAAHDNLDVSVAVVCAPASGELFPLGATLVTCNASDSAHNAATPVTFTVHVVDTTPPVFAPLENITISTGGSSAVVTFAPVAADNVSAPARIIVSCQPPSGSAFPIGATTVSCIAQDEAGNASAAAIFTVTVNRSPIAAPDTASTLEGVPVTIPVLANDTDGDGDLLALASVGAPAQGTTAIGPAGVVYTPAAGFYGTDTFTYIVTDNRGGLATGTVTVNVSRLGRFVALSRDLTWMRAGSTAVNGDVGAIERRHSGHAGDVAADDGDRDDVTVRIGVGVTMRQPSSRVVGDTVLLQSRSSIYNVIDNFLLARRNSTILGTKTGPMTVPFTALPAFPTVQAGAQRINVARNKLATLAPGAYGAVHVAAGGTLVLNGGLYQVESIDLGASATIVFRAASELRVRDGAQLESEGEADPRSVGTGTDGVARRDLRGRPRRGMSSLRGRRRWRRCRTGRGPHRRAECRAGEYLRGARDGVAQVEDTGDRCVHRRARAHRRERGTDPRQRVQVNVPHRRCAAYSHTC